MDADASSGKRVRRVSNQQVQRERRSKWNAKLDPGYSGQPLSLSSVMSSVSTQIGHRSEDAVLVVPLSQADLVTRRSVQGRPRKKKMIRATDADQRCRPADVYATCGAAIEAEF